MTSPRRERRDTTEVTVGAAPDGPRPAAPRSVLRAVTLPAEHGGWGLTLEPALLGLLVAPSLAGVLLALGAFVAFLARTPLKIALADRWRGRRLPRTVTAERVAVLEVVALVVLLVGVALTARGPFWVPLLIAAPLLGVELWFDVRSRGRRLTPELAGAIGVCSIVSAITLADGRSSALAGGLWLVLGARVLATIPFVRAQIARLHGRAPDIRAADAASVAAVAAAGAAVVLDERLLAGAVAVAVVVVLQLATRRRTPPRATVVGVEQLVIGLAVVLATAVGVLTA